MAASLGYTESKWVAEMIIAAAARNTPLRPTVARVTQLSGGVNGAWKESEWFPSMIAASVALGCMPNNHDVSLQHVFPLLLASDVMAVPH